MLTGAIVSAVPAGRFAWIGLLDGMSAWRVAFVFSGLLGIPVILLLLTFREPVRRGQPAPSRACRFPKCWPISGATGRYSCRSTAGSRCW
ncbi:hypothetical protein ACFSLT_22430 [Novosphingobium resinovorum]